MSEHFDDARVDSLPVESYSVLRKRLQSGDLFFCSGDYLVSQMIRKVTNSPWSHVGIVIVVSSIDRVLLLESVEDVGVRLAPLSKYLTDYGEGSAYDGRIVIARLSALTMTEGLNYNQKIEAITKYGADALTLPYNKEEIGQILARIVLGIGKKAANKGYICSELVASCLAEAGIGISAGSGGYVTPEDVWRDPTVNLLARIR